MSEILKIGDEVYVHGYVDEIRKDTVIIRNKGGFFGTDPEELVKAPEIIHCKDCRFYHTEWDGTEKYGADAYWCQWVDPEKDDFCSLAERREHE